MDDEQKEESNQTIKESNEREQIYWQVHIDCIRALGKLGIGYALNQRINPFFEMQRIRHLQESGLVSTTDALEARSQLGRLVLYRVEGYEPKLLKDSYK